MMSTATVRYRADSLLLNSRNSKFCCAAERCEPGPFTMLEFAEQAAFQIDDRHNPFVLVFCTIVSGRQNCDFGFLDFLAMSILHLVISRHEHPAILMTESYNFRVFHVGANASKFVPKPLRKSLNRESSCSKAHSDRLG